jgi:hypothetical protein
MLGFRSLKRPLEVGSLVASEGYEDDARTGLAGGSSGTCAAKILRKHAGAMVTILS